MSRTWNCVPDRDVTTGGLQSEETVEVVTRLARALDTTVDELMLHAPASWFQRRVADETVLDSSQCRRLLESGGIGRLAFCGADGPMVLPVNYVFSAGRAIIRTSRRSPLSGLDGVRVAFEVDQVNLDDRCGWSVLLVGVARTVPEALRELGCPTPEPWAGGDRDVWVIVHADRITGRRVGDAPCS